MSDGYGSHADFWAEVVEPAKKRQQEIEAALGEALGPWVEPHETATVVFAKMTAADIAQAILSQPAILKPLVASCNIAARAIERDLGIRNLNTYSPILTHEQAKALAEYIKPFLPDKLDISAMSHLDRTWFIDKEIRAEKGRWEKRIQEALTRLTNMPFKKRQFEAGGDRFELDAATPTSGPIRLGVDVKRIEARRDIHKRGDEIVNKATK